jgi:hypothetical protein
MTGNLGEHACFPGARWYHEKRASEFRKLLPNAINSITLIWSQRLVG